MHGENLFYRNGDLRDYLEQQKQELNAEIQNFTADYLLKANDAELQTYLRQKYIISAPIILEDKIYAEEPSDCQINVAGRFDYVGGLDDDEPHYVEGTSLTVVVPFEGDSELFHFKPSTFSYSLVRGEICEGEVRFIYNRLKQDLGKVNDEYKADVEALKKWVDWVRHDVSEYNKSLDESIGRLLSQRKEKILHDQRAACSLDIPIKRRNDKPLTYSVPTVKRKPKIERPAVSVKEYVPEPTLDIAEYDHILQIISDMTLVIERSPNAFKDMKEEDLRTHFLVQLNGHYEGQATGETFNVSGKTDILIRCEGRNVFIAECKFWTGEKDFIAAIDQLFSYTSWRDTKTAILIFNKRKDFSSVIQKICDGIKTHPCYERLLKNVSEMSFRFEFHQPKDTERKLILTVMAFDMPMPE